MNIENCPMVTIRKYSKDNLKTAAYFSACKFNFFYIFFSKMMPLLDYTAAANQNINSSDLSGAKNNTHKSKK